MSKILFFFLFALLFFCSCDSKKSHKNKSIVLKEAKSFLTKGDEYFDSNEFVQALDYYNKAIIIYEKEGNEILTGITHQRIGNIYSELNDYPRAIENYYKARKIFEENNSQELIANVLVSIAEVYVKLEDFEKALPNLYKANSFYTINKEKFKSQLIKNYRLLGVVNGYLEKNERALFYFNEAITLLSKNGDEYTLGALLNNIGAIYIDQNKFEEALENFNKSQNIFLRINNKKGIAGTLWNIAVVYTHQGKIDEAIKIYTQAIDLLDNSEGNLHYLATIYKNLSDLYKARKDYEKSLEFFQLYSETSTKIRSTETLTHIADLESQFEITKKNHEMLIKDRDNKLSKNRQNILIACLIFLIIISILVIRNQRIAIKNNLFKQKLSEKEKQQLSQDLNFKNRELEGFALRIIEKNELLENLKENISSIQKETDSTVSLANITNSIKHNLYLDKDRNELDLKIDQTHQAFLNKLSAKFPDLSKMEKRLCSFSILELSLKDIAAILNISVDGVKKSRYRLRKKLGLDESENLNEFLNNL